MWKFETKMLNTCEEEEVFFDTEDHLTIEDDVDVQEEMITSLGHDHMWFSEPQSVKERRERFLARVGFAKHSDRFEFSERITESNSEADLGSYSSDSSIKSVYDDLLSERRESNGEANCSVDYSDVDCWLDDDTSIGAEREINKRCLVSRNQTGARLKKIPSVEKGNKNFIKWWRQLFNRTRTKQIRADSMSKEPKSTPMRVEQRCKNFMELTAVYSLQQVKAHNGLIWTMKFSPDGKYLASGGEDGVVCIWRVNVLDASLNADRCSFNTEHLSSPGKKKSIHASIRIPEKIFYIEEEPIHKFYGHSSDVLDLAWSTSNHLLSSSMDKTVRLWQVGSSECLGVFRHVDYVNCVEFNPVNENYFISGSIDGKVRIWEIFKGRVEDWVNVREIVTAVCYQPNGNGFIVGSVSGNCSFYESSGEELILNAEMNIQGKKKSYGNRITSIQFLKRDSQRVMITSDDSKIRILDGLEVVRKYKGMAKSGSQISASFAPSGKHIISVGEDSRLYMWNYDEDDIHIQSTKQSKTARSCEHFLSEGVTIALPWSDSDITPNDSFESTHDSQEPLSKSWDSERFSLVNWFSMESSSRVSLTWPEERLPVCDIASAEEDRAPCNDSNGDHHLHYSHQKINEGHGPKFLPSTWGLVFVTANQDGTIRTLQNYGLPVRT